MDLAYDHITEESLPRDEEGRQPASGTAAPESTLNADIQAAYSAFSASPWASRLGGFFGNVVKQGESVYREAHQEVTALGQDATKGLSGLRDTIVNRTRGLSLTTLPDPKAASSSPASSSTTTATTTATASASASPAATAAAAPTDASTTAEGEAPVLARLKEEAAKRLRDLQRAEDAADEALIKFGTNLRDFLREAITIAPPAESGAAGAAGSRGSTVLFESTDAQGKRVIHRSRFDAQLHVLHTSPDSFAKDPSASAEFAAWSERFDIGQKTDDIAADLDKYPELRTTMEKLVPATIPYADFWKRYYFLRHGIETAEARRRDLLRAASAEEEIGWDEDSDDEAEVSDAETSNAAAAATRPRSSHRPGSTESSTTIHLPPTSLRAAPGASSTKTSADGLLTPAVARRKSDEKSQADSEASYDIVGAKSGAPSQAPSQAPNSPRRVDEDSEEEDWE
ncbi:BSD domain protein [Niveomyces insectorum RCEF 264]|uniref:BSD domain protein n=1 Tax=Niveomyces insectorum RCEF 264 TaxID=1081102 RepID=A0A167TXV5_9HYPO|nr:BSD domain protein [Niveomyces insectorum RCEF 264]